MRRVLRRNVLTAGLAVGAAATVNLPTIAGASARARPLRLGVLTDMSGVYSSLGGPGSLEAVRIRDHFGRPPEQA
jgi:hypothetical protein